MFLLGDSHGLNIETLDKDVALDSRSIQQSMLRDDAILTHPVFNRYHSETEMMRYMHSLERKRSGAEPGDDPAGFLYHEAERRRRDDSLSPGRNSLNCIRSARRNRPKDIIK
ncbi:glycine cleavage complex protein P, glycine decarboxylase [Salmonella enterica subsp. enterica serovar Daytona]|uniref:Glycine cleavage complex protein P, glycine decarboxylase n=1 Tax=Salmonella enterica subsp. enterica serovar Daytona TaxID=1962639 RepID=A0A447JCT2_SALET|nr:glycine cleavage complex protein P, glycine decarboxylase [Salmonella enterica subsp. enterica serovar Daytona]